MYLYRSIYHLSDYRVSLHTFTVAFNWSDRRIRRSSKRAFFYIHATAVISYNIFCRSRVRAERFSCEKHSRLSFTIRYNITYRSTWFFSPRTYVVLTQCLQYSLFIIIIKYRSTSMWCTLIMVMGTRVPTTRLNRYRTPLKTCTVLMTYHDDVVGKLVAGKNSTHTYTHNGMIRWPITRAHRCR